MLSVITMNVVKFSIILLNVVMLSVIMLNVVILSVIMVGVVAPFQTADRMSSWRNAAAPKL
jgi:hypothetical protein